MQKVPLKHCRVDGHGNISSFATSLSCKVYRLLPRMVPVYLSCRHCCQPRPGKVTPATARGGRKRDASSSPLTQSGGRKLKLVMLERILNPSLSLSAKNDTVHEQDLKHHCLCTVGKMPVQCFRILPPPSASFYQRLSDCGNR